MFVGLLMLMAGVMKFSVPMLREAWSGQLIQADTPFYTPNFWVVPVIEIGIGFAGLFARFGALVVCGIMVVAADVYLTVDDPGLFPLHPHQPIIPLVIIALSLLIVRRGGGSWSVD